MKTNNDNHETEGGKGDSAERERRENLKALSRELGSYNIDLSPDELERLRSED